MARLAPRFFASKLQNPIMIFGSGRSGTTYFKNLMQEHPDLATYTHDVDALFHPFQYPYDESEYDGPPIFVDPYKFNSDSSSSWPKNHTLFIRAVFGAYQYFSQKPFFLTKTVMANFMIKEMLEVLPDAKFIYMERNGVKVAFSYQKKEVEKYPHVKYRKYFSDTDHEKIRALHASYWNETIKTIHDNLNRFNPNQIYLLKYESLVSNPHASINEILNFTGLPKTDHKGFIAKIEALSNMNYKAKNELKPSEREELTALMSEGLKIAGYTIN